MVDHHGSYAGHVGSAKGRCGLIYAHLEAFGVWRAMLQLRWVTGPLFFPTNALPQQNDGFWRIQVSWLIGDHSSHFRAMSASLRAMYEATFAPYRVVFGHHFFGAVFGEILLETLSPVASEVGSPSVLNIFSPKPCSCLGRASQGMPAWTLSPGGPRGGRWPTPQTHPAYTARFPTLHTAGFWMHKFPL